MFERTGQAAIAEQSAENWATITYLLEDSAA